MCLGAGIPGGLWPAASGSPHQASCPRTPGAAEGQEVTEVAQPGLHSEAPFIALSYSTAWRFQTGIIGHGSSCSW